jgi:hypothetical protein
MKYRILIFFILAFLHFGFISAQETPQPVYNFRSNNFTGLMFQVSSNSEGYIVEFTSTKWKIVDTYFEMFMLAINGDRRVKLLFDFEPPLNEEGEYELTLKESNKLEVTNQGFSISIKSSGTWSWSNRNYDNLMLYIKESNQ